MAKNKLVLVVLDGWGVSNKKEGNAIKKANPKYFNELKKKFPYTELKAAEQYVGLMKGNMGNSEVGHLHIGAGRLVKQDLVKIFDSIKDKSFFKNKILTDAVRHAKKNNSRLHLLGLVSDAGVHSDIRHMFALLKLANMHKIRQVYVHAILDGRDTPPKSALKFIRQIERELKKYSKSWKIATVMGRYYAMDRDNRWNREHKAYDAVVNLEGLPAESAEAAIKKSYSRGQTDEFVEPAIVSNDGNARAGDSIIFFNFRSDRARELTRAFVQGRFNKFKRKKLINLKFVCLTQYDEKIKVPVAFPPVYLKNTLGEVISNNKLRQLRLAETEKWAHVTFFFNGLSGRVFKNEDRLLVPSLRGIPTYDLRPEMSAYKVADKAVEAINSKKYDFILINFANADMVGHTGNFPKIIESIKATDECLKRVTEAAIKNSCTEIITADHGNAEQKKGFWQTSHTLNKVPFILVSDKKYNLDAGKNIGLYNIAPTALKIMGLKIPKEMCSPIL